MKLKEINQQEIFSLVSEKIKISIKGFEEEIEKANKDIGVLNRILTDKFSTQDLLKIVTEYGFSTPEVIQTLESCVQIGLDQLPDAQYNKIIEVLSSEINERIAANDNTKIALNERLEFLSPYKDNKFLQENFLYLFGNIDLLNLNEEETKNVLLFACLKSSEVSTTLEEEIEEVEEKLEEKEEIIEEEKEIEVLSLKEFKEKYAVLQKRYKRFVLDFVEGIDLDQEQREFIKKSNALDDEKRGDILNNYWKMAHEFRNSISYIVDVWTSYDRISSKITKKNYDELASFVSEKTIELNEKISEIKKIKKKYYKLYESLDEKEEIQEIEQLEEKDEKAEEEEEPIKEIVPEEEIFTAEEIANEYRQAIEEEAQYVLDFANISENDAVLIGYKNAIAEILSTKKKDNTSYANLEVLVEELKNFIKDYQSSADDVFHGVGPKNIILFIKNKKDGFVIEEDLDSFDSGLREQFRQNIVGTLNSELSIRSWISELRQKQSNHAIKSSSKAKYYVRDKNDKAFSYPCVNATRLAVYPVSLCQENKEKLQKEFNLPELETVLLIGGYQTHDGIEELGRKINNNRDYIIEVDEMFKDPETSISAMKSIILESSEEYKKLNTSVDDKQLGGIK